MRTLLLAAAAAVTLAACSTTTETTTASNAAPANRDCFRNEDIFGYGIVDDHTVSVRAGSRRYLLTTNWNARDLDWTQSIAIRSTTSWICTGNGLGVEVIGGEPVRSYPINSITRAPEEPVPSGS